VVRNPLIRPRLALYDPELAVETPPTLTASTGVNALAHCVEALYSKNATPEDRGMAEHAAGLLIKHLPLCTAAPGDLYHRYKLFEGSMEAGLVLASAGMGVHHGLCHVLGGRFNVPHGELNAVVLPHAMRFNLPIAESAYGSLAAALNVREGPDVPEQVVRATAEFIRHLGLPQRLRDMGIPEDSLPSLAEEALQSSAVRNNPRPIAGVSDLLGILTSAW
ncbi:MAG TPA: iron-containing alcohol dehydrogenase, partial [Thermoplasmata archaeon]|nr:iron-containing alcohol dehydrogenase [Thermoplasmata archaeon]